MCLINWLKESQAPSGHYYLHIMSALQGRKWTNYCHSEQRRVQESAEEIRSQHDGSRNSSEHQEEEHLGTIRMYYKVSYV